MANIIWKSIIWSRICLNIFSLPFSSEVLFWFGCSASFTWIRYFAKTSLLFTFTIWTHDVVGGDVIAPGDQLFTFTCPDILEGRPSFELSVIVRENERDLLTDFMCSELKGNLQSPWLKGNLHHLEADLVLWWSWDGSNIILGQWQWAPCKLFIQRKGS